MGYIRKRGDRYQVLVKNKGRQVCCGTYRRKHEADTRLRIVEKQVAEGRLGSKNVVTFSDFSAEWLEKHAKLKKPSTYSDYQGVISKHLIPYFRNTAIQDITTTHVQGYVTYKLKDTHPRTINKTLMVLGLMFRHAQQWGYVYENPVGNVERPREPHGEMAYLTPAEVRRLLSELQGADHAVVATAVLTGMRRGELTGLKWPDVDLEAGIIHVRRSYNYKTGFSSPKTKRGSRAVLIPTSLVEILTKLNNNVNTDGLVFSKDGEPLPENFPRSVLQPALKRAGLRRIRFHDLRHTYAAMMISNGENIKFVAQQLGHTSTRTTWDIYAHLLPEASDGFGERLDDMVFNRTNG